MINVEVHATYILSDGKNYNNDTNVCRIIYQVKIDIALYDIITAVILPSGTVSYILHSDVLDESSIF